MSPVITHLVVVVDFGDGVPYEVDWRVELSALGHLSYVVGGLGVRCGVECGGMK